MIFFAAIKMRTVSTTWVIRSIVLGTGALAVLILLQSSALSGAAQDLVFAHEGVALLAIGAMLGVVMLLRAERDRTRLLIVGYELLLLAAMGSTGRRSATLVVLAALAIVLALLYMKRPSLALALTLVGGVVMTGYLGAYWNKEYGALAQPARAVRAFVDDAPARDTSSDTYREFETDNVIETIRASRNFGVGFGREFAFFWPLPDLTDFWPLQHFTPHNNVLWLWLKMGITGIAVILGVWALALSRCIRAVREAPRGAFPVVPVVLAATLAIMFAYNWVDIGLASTRGVAPVAIALALSFALPSAAREPNTSTDGGAE